MKKFIIGVLSLGLVAAGGVTGVSAQNGQMEMPYKKSGEMMEMEGMHQTILDSTAVINFGQAKNLMKEMHPEMSTKQIKVMYTKMHGTNGAAPSANFEEMNMGEN
ncbi:hypothetical protein [Halobacillus halophilus]|uniref:hypothetical protein n=1 Tax=Halobacillus halophilus TaxID=1570 RepID=UPI001CD3CEF0|nr:hypothetical protein [Halobacillus halophilus]MCA1012037.1 hypothetical protein [Halobacillus halophilus]